MRHINVICCVGALGLAPIASASHIPGHNDSDPTFPLLLPGPEFFDGNIVFVTFIGPPAGTVITNTTWDITFETNPGGSASDLLMELTVPVDGSLVEYTVSGADLGFPDAGGVFSATLTTDVFNGVVFNAGPFPGVVLNFEVGGPGHFIDSQIVFDVIPVPAPAGLALFALAPCAALRRRR